MTRPLVAAFILATALPSLRADTTRIVSFANTHGTSTSNYVDAAAVSNALNRILALSPRPDAVLLGGDLVFSLNNPDHGFNCFTNLMARLTTNGIPWYCALGNDDITASDWYSAWTNAFRFPSNGPSDWKGLAYYVDVGPARIIVLDSVTRGKTDLTGNRHRVMAAQRTWLQTVIGNSSPKRFDVVLTHEPAYPLSTTQAAASLANSPSDLAALMQILSSSHCTAFLSGHEHLSARRMLDTRDDATWTNGIPHIVHSLATPLYTNLLSSTNYPLPDATNVEHQSFVIVDLDGSSGSGTARTYALDTGELLDEIALAGKPNGLSIAFKTRILAEGLGTLPAWGTVTFERPVTQDVSVTIHSADTSEITLTNVVIVPAGDSAAPFDLTVQPDAVADGIQAVQVTVTAPDGQATTGTVEVGDTGGVDTRVRFYSPSLAGRFVTNFMTRQVSAPAMQNFSGCAFTPETGELLVVCKTNSTEMIQVFDTNGVYRRRIDLRGVDDVEGFCLVDAGSNRFAMVQEGAGNDIFVVTIQTNTTVIDKATDADVIHVTLPSKVFNKGLEGITYDPGNRCYYVVQEQSPMGLYRVMPAGTTAVAEVIFDAQTALAGLATDLSDLAYDPYSGHLLLLTDEGKAVIECDMTGRVLASLPIPATQPEGIVLPDDGTTLYVVGEPSEYFRFALQPATSRGGEGTNVTFTVGLSRPLTNAMSVGYTISSARAIAGQDYSPSTGTVSLAAMSQSADFEVSMLADGDIEPDEILELSLVEPSAAMLGRDAAQRHVIAGDGMRLVVSSPYGTASPPAGTNLFSYLSQVTCRVINSPVALGVGTQALCVSWAGAGSIPASGAGASTPTFTLSNDSSIAWQWQTNVWLGATADDGGSVQGGNRWVVRGTNIAVAAVTNRYFDFRGWGGDVGVAETNDVNLPLLMDQTRQVSAHFAAQLAPLATPLWWLSAYYGNTNDPGGMEDTDTDEDSSSAWQEYIAGTVPIDSSSVLRFTEIRAGGSNVELGWAGVADRTYGVYRLTDPADSAPEPLDTNLWPDPGPITHYTDMAATNGKAYYRLDVRLRP